MKGNPKPSFYLAWREIFPFCFSFPGKNRERHSFPFFSPLSENYRKGGTFPNIFPFWLLSLKEKIFSFSGNKVEDGLKKIPICECALMEKEK
ncbi:MAG: hypothetical protein LKE52_00270 [Bacilli bacterium]|nr:hypothetical protein [Bacilli bacterium]